MHNSPQHICALIPTYNNAGTIVDVVRRTHTQLRDIIVVVDGSTDNTVSLLEQLNFPVTIVQHDHNRGKGCALKTGFRRAMEMGFDYVLTLDGDGQHYPEDIPVLRAALDVHPDALIVGSRQFTDENMPGKSKFANRFSNFWFRLQTTINLPDTQTGMRIYPVRRLHGLSLLTSRYEAELELLVFSAWHNIPLIPVPIRVYYPPVEERVSHFRPAQDFTRISILNCFLCIGALLFGYINMYWRTLYAFTYFGLSMLLLVSTLSPLYFLLCGRGPKSKARFHRFVQGYARHFQWAIQGLHVRVNNPMKITVGEEPSIIVSNHQSLIDVISILALSPKIVVMVKSGVWSNPIFAVLARMADFFPAAWDEDRKLEHVRQLTGEGYSVLIFSEGTRSYTGEVGRFHRGAFYYAEQLHLPIQPILIEGMIDHIGKRQFMMRPARVQLSILPTLTADDASMGRNYKRRAKSLELNYTSILHNHKPLVGVLGAGVGGLFTGALLTREGYPVVVLEQLPVYGGGLYSFERDAETWQTGLHLLSGMQEGGKLRTILDSLDIHLPVEPTTLDHSPAELIGEAEWQQTEESPCRLIGGSQQLADALALYISRHGGRVLTGQRVKALTQDAGLFVIQTGKQTLRVAKVVNTLHPKQLLALTNLPLYRPATMHRIQSTKETFGSFKLYIKLKPQALAYDSVTHYLPNQKTLILTPPTEPNQQWARTIEALIPLNYEELRPWQTDRKTDYAGYEAFKQQLSEQVLTTIEQVYPSIRACVASMFSSTSLTFRDDYLSPEGAMFGLAEPIGAVTTRVQGLYMSGQNIFLHGLCGTAMTAMETVHQLTTNDQ